MAAPSLFEVVHDVVADIAPEELPLLAALSHLPPDAVGRRLARGTSGDDPLGFGMGEIAAVVVPVAWAAVQQVVNHMATSAADGMAARMRTRVRKLLRRPAAAAQLPHFGPAELDEVQAAVLELAGQAGMKRTRAELLAYKVVDRLKNSGEEKS